MKKLILICAAMILAASSTAYSTPILEYESNTDEQVALYDTYGQTGYIGMGVSNDILEGTIRRLEQSLDAIQTDKG